MGLLSKFVSRNNIIRFLCYIKSYIDSKIENLTKEIKLNEKVVAKSLCDLDYRIREFDEESMDEKKIIAKSLCDLDYRIKNIENMWFLKLSDSQKENLIRILNNS